MTVRWTFTDTVTLDEYTFDVNPNSGGTETHEKEMTYVATTATGGRAIAFEGRPKPRLGKFSGTLLEESHYNALKTWYDVHNQIEMTDDLGRTNSIYITRFEATRVRSAQHPWKHTYSVDYVIIDWD